MGPKMKIPDNMLDKVCRLHSRSSFVAYVDDSRKAVESMRADGIPAFRQKKRNSAGRLSLLALLLLLFNASYGVAQINVDVSMANQTFEGWGTSLAWFANSVGGWSNSTN